MERRLAGTAKLGIVLGVLLAVLASAPGAPGAARNDRFPLRVGSHGPRVKDAQWLLAGHNVYRFSPYHAKPSGYYGKRTATATKKIKFRLGYRQASIGGEFGRLVRGYLTGTVKLPKANRTLLLHRRPDAYPLHVGSHGRRVRDAQWLLAGHNRWHLRAYKGKLDGSYGTETARATAYAKWRLGYPPYPQDRRARVLRSFRSYGLVLRGYLLPKGRPGARTLPGTYLVRLHKRRPAPVLQHVSSRDEKIQLGLETAVYAAHHEWLTGYTQTYLRWAGMHMAPLPAPPQPSWADCSSFVTWVYWVAHLPDPNGLEYRAGFTGTLATHGFRVSFTSLKPGDLVLYGGPYPYRHVTIYIGNGLVVSHGSQSGPHIASTFYRWDAAEARRYP